MQRYLQRAENFIEVIIHSLFPALNFVSSLAISACLTPTDPVLASAIIGGNFAIKNVPGHLRRILRFDLYIIEYRYH